MERILIILIILIILPISTYTGWYIGNINGYDRAKKQQNKNTGYNVKRKIIPDQLKRKTSTKTIRNQPKYRKTAQQSLNEMNKIVEATKALNKRQTSNHSKKITEKNSGCRWTVGRIENLERIIKTGGKGRESVFCEEYNKRVYELTKLNCQTKTPINQC